MMVEEVPGHAPGALRTPMRPQPIQVSRTDTECQPAVFTAGAVPSRRGRRGPTEPYRERPCEAAHGECKHHRPRG